MKVQSGRCSLWLHIIYAIFVVGSVTSRNNTRCPFDYLYHFGDSVTDIGNYISLTGQLRPENPSTKLPYGMTFPGYPTGRWSDGRLDIDLSSAAFGCPAIVPYLEMRFNKTNDGVIFSVARSPVLDRAYLQRQNITIPYYAQPLHVQMNWFRDFKPSVCKTPQECAEFFGKSLLLMGDIEATDIGYALTQGKSIEEAKTYIPDIIATVIDASIELIKLGFQKVIIPGNTPLGCYTYVLTEFDTPNKDAYDEIGCLLAVNDLIIQKNKYLQMQIKKLQHDYPQVHIYYGDMYTPIYDLMLKDSLAGKKIFKACCGMGGKHNFDQNKFCGDANVPVCDDPNNYIFWDGYHFTEGFQTRFQEIAIVPALKALNCSATSLY